MHLKLFFLLILVTGSAAYYNENLCKQCAELVYGVLLPNDVETLISFTEVYLQYNICPNYFSNLPGYNADNCVSWPMAIFDPTYRLFYQLAFPFRDSYCPMVCDGDSGESLVYLKRKRK
ncbi:unnamed protein product [Caenorhabditis brenneri]